MTDRPILFSGPMVRALLDGRKTQTRRMIKLPTKTASGGPIYERKDMGGWEVTAHGGPGVFRIVGGERVPAPEEPGLWHRTTGVCVSLPIKVSDRLWVKENGWERPERTERMMRNGADTWEPYYFDADLDEQDHHDFKAWGFKRRPSIHMPRVHSRLTLHVTDVRVQRLQEISEQDAVAEGLAAVEDAPATLAYRYLWDTINGPGSWEANPWVAAYTFTVELRNIDAPAHATIDPGGGHGRDATRTAGSAK